MVVSMYLFLIFEDKSPLKSTFSLSKGAVTLMKCTSWALLKRDLYSAHTGQEADIFLISSIENDKFRLLT